LQSECTWVQADVIGGLVCKRGGCQRIKPPMRTPDKQRKAAERDRMHARGFKRFEAWVHPEDWPAVREYIERKNRKRSALLNILD
jgi:hypothetical protein